MTTQKLPTAAKPAPAIVRTPQRPAPATTAPAPRIRRDNKAWDGGVVYTEKNSPARVLYYGDDFRLANLPVEPGSSSPSRRCRACKTRTPPSATR